MNASHSTNSRNASDTFGFDRVDPAALRVGGSRKWLRYDESVLCAWIADMDFPIAPAIRDGIAETMQRGMWGYAIETMTEELVEVFCRWVNQRYLIGAQPPDVRICTDVVQALHACVHGFTEQRDSILLLTPLYPPFETSVSVNGRRVVEHRMTPDAAGVWRFDEQRLRDQVAAERPRVLMLCSPHNPVGRLWDRDELLTLGSLAIEFDMLVVADEIHADLVYSDRPMIGFASLSEELRARTITITSANKAFNLAGLKIAFLAFGSRVLADAFDARVPQALLGAPSTIGIAATVAAYTRAQPWLDAVNGYITTNLDSFATQVRARVPSVTVVRPEATYLSWLDFSNVAGIETNDNVAFRLLNEARLGVNDGATFGAGLEHFARINLATSRTIVDEAVDRIARWVDNGCRPQTQTSSV